MKHLLLALALSACSATLAHAQAFDPREYQNQVVGERTRVLVLGSPHLSGAPDTFDPAVLEPLLQRLEAFDPDVIAIEALPPAEFAAWVKAQGGSMPGEEAAAPAAAPAADAAAAAPAAAR